MTVDNIQFLGHATFKIKGTKVIYTDPFEITEKEETADIILITHSHYDHCSLDDVKKIVGNNTTIVASKDCIEKLKEITNRVNGLSPGEHIKIDSVIVEAVPAYNIGKSFHPRENNWNGYVFTMDGTAYYHTGDTDRIPEMERITADVVFLPVGGTYTMNYKEAIEAARILKPKIAIPMHYGSIVGSRDDAEAFARELGEKAVILPQKR